jgi:hypothetical protein
LTKFARNSAYKGHFAPQAGRRQSVEEEYVNPVTKVLGNFISKEKSVDVLNSINWTKKKRSRTSLTSLAADIESALNKKEWFVTGDVDPSFFSDSFAFQDPDVKIKGIESYARGVNKIFSQKDSRAEIIAARVNGSVPDSITVTWRLSGSVNIGPGLKIKPYIVYTDFKVDPSDGLIVFQEDRFSIPGYDIILSAFFPFLVAAGVSFLAPPAAPVEPLREEFLKKEQELKRLKPKQGSTNKRKGLFW